jgi:hypothetical protein
VSVRPGAWIRLTQACGGIRLGDASQMPSRYLTAPLSFAVLAIAGWAQRANRVVRLVSVRSAESIRRQNALFC